MSDPIVEARLAALEKSIRPWNRPSPFTWNSMDTAPQDRDILLTIQETNGVRVRVAFHQVHGNRHWRTITGQRIPPGCALAWMPLPEPAHDLARRHAEGVGCWLASEREDSK